MPWKTLKRVIKHIDVITINDEEARQLTSEYSLVKAAEEIQKMGPEVCRHQKGENMAHYCSIKREVFFAPALPLEEVFDPTGAGDTFAGGFAGYLAATSGVSFANLKNAVIHGSKSSLFLCRALWHRADAKLEKGRSQPTLASVQDLDPIRYKHLIRYNLPQFLGLFLIHTPS